MCSLYLTVSGVLNRLVVQGKAGEPTGKMEVFVCSVQTKEAQQDSTLTTRV